ncbi:MAG: NAD(P)H-dependent oxidoreductase [Desulfohalobiaceae bacterium]|nr:NAD(P)H-dependent oxidoreductase [Desulfohalobiaceae bacterium]
MQILVLYYSKTGNTRKLAEAIAQGAGEVRGARTVLKATGEVTKEDFLSADGLIAGSPVYFGSMAAEMKQVVDGLISIRKKMEGKMGAAFATSGDATGGKETTMFSILQAMLICGMVITGDPLSATGHYGVACTGAPDEKSLENGRKLGRRVAELGLRLQAES